MHYMLTADFIDELAEDNILSPQDLTFKDLGMNPRATSQGVCVDHIRYWRAGGYYHGTVAGLKAPERALH